MRKIDYIFIDSDTQTPRSKSDRYDVSNLRYHYVVSQGLGIINTTPIQLTTQLIVGPIYDPDKYNKCSIFIRYCGSLRPEAWLLEPETSSAAIMAQRAALLQLLVRLRKHFPEAKILGVSEIDGKGLHSRNIIVSDAMNQIRRALSDYP